MPALVCNEAQELMLPAHFTILLFAESNAAKYFGMMRAGPLVIDRLGQVLIETYIDCFA